MNENEISRSDVTPQVQDVLVTIIITHYNYSEFVEAALNSVIAQDHKKFECIIVDDCSEKIHLKRLRKIVGVLGDERIKLIELPKNKGQTNAVFEGLHHSSGEFVALLDPDDLYEASFLGKMLKCHLNPCIYAPVAACEMGVFRVGGAALSRSYVGFKREAIANNELPRLEASLYDFGFSKYYPPETIGWLWATTSSLMFRRDSLEILRRKSYMKDMKICADTYCVIGAHLLGGTLFLDEQLSWRGIHKGNAVESDQHFSSYQMRHQPNFVDLSAAIKTFVTKTILEYDCLKHLKPERLLKTLTSHFSKSELQELLADQQQLAITLLTHATSLERQVKAALPPIKPAM